MMNIDLFQIGVILVVILFSMTLHEAMHAFTSYWLGDDTAKHSGRLTLNPIAHIDPFMTILLPVFLAIAGLPIFGGAKPVPFNPLRVRYGDWGSAIVAVAGPITNLVIAFFVYGIHEVLVLPQGSATSMVFQLIVLVNLGFFIFNMLPLPPLDGSRLLYALAPDTARRVMDVIERNGLIVVFAVVLLFSSQIGQFILSMRSLIIGVFDTIF